MVDYWPLGKQSARIHWKGYSGMRKTRFVDIMAIWGLYLPHFPIPSTYKLVVHLYRVWDMFSVISIVRTEPVQDIMSTEFVSFGLTPV